MLQMKHYWILQSKREAEENLSKKTLYAYKSLIQQFIHLQISSKGRFFWHFCALTCVYWF